MINTYTLPSEKPRSSLDDRGISRRSFSVQIGTQPRAVWLGRHNHLLIEVPAGGGSLYLSEGLSGGLGSLYVREGRTVIFDGDTQEYIFLATDSAPLTITIVVW